MAINKKKIIERVQKSTNKKKFTFTISPAVYKSFQDECDRLKMDYAPTVESLMISFVEDDETIDVKKK